jgi:hypothetical protein
MKDELPQKVKKIECGIINLQNTNKEGSHWTAYYKNKDKKYYFDSYGDAQPPKGIVEYLGLKNSFGPRIHFKIGMIRQFAVT